MAWYNWSQTASANASSDPVINWAEGQSPGSINDSARAMMAVSAKYRDDISGAIVTSGSSTAYTVASNSVFDTLAHLSGQMIAFTPHATNGATVTLNVDGLGAKPLRTSPNVELLAGTIIQGTPYVATYNNSDGAFYLQGFVGNPYNIPIGAGMDFWGATAPNSSFVFPMGQQISTTTYSALYAVFGPNRYGTDTGGNFFLPDKTGRVSAMQEASATRLTSTYFGGNSTVLGANGGGESTTLTAAQIPSITSTNSGITLTNGTTTTFVNNAGGSSGGTAGIEGSAGAPNATVSAASVFTNVTVSAQGISTSNNTGGNPHRTVQPTIVCNYIIRII